MSEVVKGFKVFNADWTCRDKKYVCPGRFKEEGELKACGHGMHFCLDAAGCFNYYNFDPDNHVAEIIAHGNVVCDGDKCCTDDIEIIREIPWDEVLKIVNIGKNCTGCCNTGDYNTGNRNTGRCNTGDYNTGDCNTGDWNTGDYNTGNRNTGRCNTGDWNTGNRNTGRCNTGDYNTGDYNTGNYNTGDWNKSSFNTGCFMTEEPKIHLFNKLSGWSYRDWLDSDARHCLEQIPNNVVEWVCSGKMTDEEKAGYPTHECTGGYLKILDESECAQIWWDGLSSKQKDSIRNIPNYNKEIFEQITGIKTE